VNPFDLRGPEFLLFYLVLSGVVIIALVFLRGMDEPQASSKPPIDDPYLVAFLRGGNSEALRVAALSLIDRGLLVLKGSGTSTLLSGPLGGQLETKDPASVDSVKRPIEKEILEAFKTAQPIATTLESLEFCSACSDYAMNLERLGLVPDEAIKDTRRKRNWVALGILLGVAGIKILVALSRGRTNIFFLVILTAAACLLIWRLKNPFRTARGEEFLQDVKNIFSGLPLRASTLRPGGASSDLVWLASAYGLGAVPIAVFPQVSILRAYSSRSQSFWSGSGSGSSTNSCSTFSSCGGADSGGGSGCGGGGGCGCGGCGGCGS
jgi:uncharacterized protein (TIGR04222 family)